LIIIINNKSDERAKMEIVKEEGGFLLQKVSQPGGLNNDAGTWQPEEVREKVLRYTRDFKLSWRNLAHTLQIVHQNKLYKQWGYSKFEEYTNTEVNVSRHTAVKLIQTYDFLKKEAPKYVLGNAEEDDRQNDTKAPSFESVLTLKKAHDKLDDENYQTIKNDILNESKDVGAVKKDITQLIKQRKINDPADEKQKQDDRIIGRTLFLLKGLKRDIEVLNVLPETFKEDISKLIMKIEDYMDSSKDE